MCERQEITFADMLSTSSLSKVVLAANVRLDYGWSSGIAQDPFELLLIADSVLITSPVTIDLSRNRTNSNGYLGIICRHIVFKGSNASLTVQLGARETYRKFFIMTEEVWEDGKKISAGDSVLQQKITSTSNRKNAPTAGMAQLEVSSLLAGTGTAYKQVSSVKTYKDLSKAIAPVSVFNDLFSNWVLAMYKAVYHRLVGAGLKDDYNFAETYLTINSMPSYEITGPVSDKLSQTRSQLATLVSSRFKNGNMFNTRLATPRGYTDMVSVFETNRVKNFLLPDKVSIAATMKDKVPALGYMLMTDPSQKEFILEMEIELSNDIARSTTLISQCRDQHRTVETFSGQVSLTELKISGAELNSARSTITPVAGKLYRVHLAAPTGPSNLFFKLFNGANTDIFISGEYMNIPIKIPLVLDEAVFAGKTPSHLNLDPENFGQYFEQIDQSDDMLQRFTVFNNIAAAPKDSLSGPMQFVELSIAYNDGMKDLVKQIRLSPAQSLGDHAAIDIFKLKKQYVPITLDGRAVYENGTYQLTSRSTNDGEMTLNITAAMLK
jgi:hypothetical protein